MIHATILGRLGRDAELKVTTGGTEVLNFPVATDHGWGQDKQTMWVRCSLFGQRAKKLAQYLAKGSMVLVTGEVYSREWTKQDGTPQWNLEMRVSELEFAGGSKADSQQDDYQAPYPAPAPAPRQPAPQPQYQPPQDDIPF